MPLSKLIALVEAANRALQLVGPNAVAERLTLFRPLATALESFALREEEQLQATANVRRLSRELSNALRQIEMAAHSGRKPADTALVTYYETAIELKRELRRLEKAAVPISMFEIEGEPDEQRSDRD